MNPKSWSKALNNLSDFDSRIISEIFDATFGNPTNIGRTSSLGEKSFFPNQQTELPSGFPTEASAKLKSFTKLKKQLLQSGYKGLRLKKKLLSKFPN